MFILCIVYCPQNSQYTSERISSQLDKTLHCHDKSGSTEAAREIKIVDFISFFYGELNIIAIRNVFISK